MVLLLPCTCGVNIDVFLKMEYYLARNNQKKACLLASLKTYAKDKNVENLAHSVGLLLNNPMERKLLKEIRSVCVHAHVRLCVYAYICTSVCMCLCV